MDCERADAISLGAFRFWLMFRVVQLIFAAVILKAVVSQRAFHLETAIPLVAFIAVVFGFHPQAYGRADIGGITYRQYLWSRHVSWRDVRLLKSQTYTNVQTISIRLDRAWPWSRVDFLNYATTARKSAFREESAERALRLEQFMDMGQRWNIPLQ